MAQISSFLRDAGALFTNLFLQPDWRNVFDVAIMTVIIYYIIKLLIHTRASAVFKGIAVVLVFAWVSDALQLNALNWMLQQIISMGLLVLVIMFQPELRRGLEQLGRSNWSRHMFTSARKTAPAGRGQSRAGSGALAEQHVQKAHRRPDRL